MRITAELSLYPLAGDYLPRIESAIRTLEGVSGIDVVVNQMSTQLRGEAADVMRAITALIDSAFADGTPQSLVAKILNADLPIDQSPDL